MKKIALGFLSVFILLGGVLFSACDKKVSLSLLTSQEITIFTNDESAENFVKDNIEVLLENSSDGVKAEILKGDDVIKLSEISEKSNGRYSFDIETLESKKSGKAEVKVYSIEDPSQSKIIYVNVNTILEGIDGAKDDNVDARSNYFVVKGERTNQSIWKDLNVKEFFEFNPVTANVYDVNWTFENDEVQIVDGDKILAVIENDKLWVSKDYNLQTISLKATDITKGANGLIQFKVLEDSTIKSFTMGGTNFYSNSQQKVESASYEFVRNNVYESNISGQIVINTSYDVTFEPVVKIGNQQLEKEEWLKYFSFDFSKPEINEVSKTTTYDFTINAYDALVYNKFGDLSVDFSISYTEYNYAISTNVNVLFKTFYQATNIEVMNADGKSLNKNEIDVFSNYQNGEGYEITAILMPDDVGLDNSNYAISIDTTSLGGMNPSDFVKFFYRGEQLVFENVAGSYVYTTITEDAVLSGDKIYVVATENYDVLENVKVEFIPYSNPSKSTYVNMNFYKISTGDKLQVSSELGDNEFYISSSLASERKLKLNFKISGISTIAGIEIVSNNSKFVFSNEYTQIETGESEGVAYVVMSCEVELSDYNFEERGSFYFKHISGKGSGKFYINSFIPLETLTISNNDKSATNYYNQKETEQDYVLNADGAVEKVAESASVSLSSIMLEAGTYLPISVDTRNATMTDNGLVYKFLSYDDLRNSLIGILGIDLNASDEVAKLDEIAEKLIKNETVEIDTTLINETVNSLDFVATKLYDSFVSLDETAVYFSINANKLVLTDNEFKGFVCAIYNGYDENHNQKSLLRFFAIESFNKVTHFSANIKTASLYTSQTLSYADMAKSYVDITLTFRTDSKIPTYTNDLSLLSFKSSLENFEYADKDGYFTPVESALAQNSYYSISDMTFINNGCGFRFRITANSTNLQTQVRDVLSIVYRDENGFEKATEIQIQIQNVKRIESVEWTTRTVDDEIYLNLTSAFEYEKNFTITTSFTPSDANDTGLSYIYSPIAGTRSDLEITTSSIGSTFNLNLNTNKGGYGYLYLLPNDMVKVVSGIRHFMVYKYSYDKNGNLVETPVLIEISKLKDYYNMLVNPDNVSSEFDQYFLNNDGEKIYYKDIVLQIKITIADGLSQETAIRVYSQSDLEVIDYAKYYQIMNDITLQNWKVNTDLEFSGMLFGKSSDITLTFDNSQQLFSTIATKGIVKDLTLAGKVVGTGFVADKNNGTIDNITIDVYYDRTNNVYAPSKLDGSVDKVDSSSYVGGFVGQNIGTISNCYSFGTSIVASQTKYVGGIAGKNSGTIEASGVEFYKFKDKDENDDYKNTINTEYTEGSDDNQVKKSSTVIGGIVGFAYAQSKISKSYVYAYSLLNGGEVTDIFLNVDQDRAAFVGVAGDKSVVEESFAFLGDLSVAYTTTTSAIVKNSYVTYRDENNSDIITSDIFDADSVKTSITESDKTNSTWTNLINRLDKTVWEVENIDKEVNFGFMHLKNVEQTRETDVTALVMHDVGETNIKALKVSVQSGILFAYDPVESSFTQSEQSALDALNRITLQELFHISEKEAQTLLITSTSKDIVISKNAIQILSSNLNEFELIVYSKMDFSKSNTFKFVILNNLPKVTMTLDGQVLQNGQIMLLQTGSSNTRSVYFDFNNSIYLGGSNVYRAETNDYSIDLTIDKNTLANNNAASDLKVSAALNGTKLSLTGKTASSDLVNVEAKLSVANLRDDYNNIVKDSKVSNFDLSVFDGATSLVIEDSSELMLKAGQNDSFEAIMQTDSSDDNLIFKLQYGEIEIEAEEVQGNYVKFKVDEKLTLNVSWTKKETSDKTFTFKVLVEIDQDSKHLVDQTYDFNLIINAKSLQKSHNFEKTLPVYVSTQEVSDVDILAYDVKERQIKNSVLYLNPTSKSINAIAPSSDAIVAVVIDPAYALMSHYTLTYSLIKNSGTTDSSLGTVNITKLSYNSMYGYYANTASTTLIENGIKVNLTDADKTGNGVYYFRVYVSGTFASACDLKISLNIYSDQTCVKSASQTFIVDYLANANISVNDSSNYIMSKGSSATVKITVGLDQDLYSLSLQNNAEGISLSSVEEKTFDSYKLYTATLIAYVDAKLVNGKESGIFCVNATVSRIVNGELELKTSKATVYLVDFAVDINGIKVNSNGATSTYNGETYDVFYAYINSSETLRFDYPILPEEYIYNSADASEVAKVEELQKKQNEFLQKNYYKDDDALYYINHKYNQRTGKYESVSLRQQLSYAVDEESSSKIYSEGGYFISNDKIISISGDDNALKIKGLRTGKQLMKLQTTIICDGVEFVKDYYFLIVVEVWSDEEVPTQITSGEQLVDYATNSEHSDDYILMNDIVLENYTPLDTDLIDSLDGNGYTIHLNSFAVDEESSSLDLALFNTVASNTTLKNVRVNIYGAGEINVDINQYKTINIAGFVLNNNGIIYNCEVVSYFDENYQTQSMKRSTSGLVVNYMLGANTDPINMTSSMKITSNVAGFAITNNRSIMNSRVGGASFRHIILEDDVYYAKTEYTDIFNIIAQGNVAGFVISNGTSKNIDTSTGEISDNTGYISACFVDNVEIINNMDSATSVTAGFVMHNYNNIQGCYIEGCDDEKEGAYITGSKISAIGYIGGFVYENDGLVKNSYSNIKIDNENSVGSYVAGFVYKNNVDAEIKLCFASCRVAKRDINEMQFSGVDSMVGSLNNGTIEFSYYYNKEQANQTNENALSVGPLAVSDMTNQDTFYGFSFASSQEKYDGIWCLEDEVLSLVSANNIALSNRYAVTTGNITTLFYNKTILDVDTLQTIDLSYGSIYNPIIIRNAEEFAKAMGKATTTEISSYKEYYNDTTVFGNYRIVNNIDMSEIDQNAEGTDTIKITTTRKTFKGLIDGNGFTISNLNLGSSVASENYGLFAKLDQAVIMNLDFIVESVHNRQANIVGALAGTAVDTRILAINIRPKDGAGDTSIMGNNVVGGVVGMLFGESKIHDVVARNIYVYSSYGSNEKTIEDNQKYIEKFRDLIEDGVSLKDVVSKISYAGAIVGFADVYTLKTDNDVYFDINPNVQAYDLVTVHVYDSVNIYAEVAGGLFGYVGPSTYVYDATIQLNASMDYTINPSYIISKNLYAGGLIGENHGAIFGSYASYEESLQDEIDANQNSYYNTNSTVERGQQSIFSYSSAIENTESNSNNPLFIGGLVGYMDGGYIYVSYNKLNVISNSSATLAVGGVVGFVDSTDRLIDVSLGQNLLQTNIFLYDVYSSGDFYINNSTSLNYYDKIDKETEKAETTLVAGAGIIGALGSEGGSNATAVMKNVTAVNYLSVTGKKLTCDDGVYKTIDSVETYVASRHYSLIGNILNYDSSNNNFEFEVLYNLKNNIYVLSDENEKNSVKNPITNANQTYTVGGYNEIVTNNTSLKLNAFAFYASDYQEDILLSVTNIGDSGMSNYDVAHAQMYSKFLPVGWTLEYWVHDSDMLFPQIELLPKVQVYYLDAVWNEESAQKAYDVLTAVNSNPTATIVVRGKKDPDNINDQTSIDVNLTKEYLASKSWKLKDGSSIEAFLTLSNFSGRIISYYDYNLNDDLVGKLIQDSSEGGGKLGDSVGIIIDSSFFGALSEGARVEGLNVYMNASSETQEKTETVALASAITSADSTDGVIDYSFVATTANLAIFKNVNFILNADVKISNAETEDSSALVVPYANTTSFSNINIKARQIDTDNDNKVDSPVSINVGGLDTNYAGLLAGKITQNTSYTPVVVENNKVFAIDSDGKLLDSKTVSVNLTVAGNEEVYAGLFAGTISKVNNAVSSLEVGISQIDNVELTVSCKTTSGDNIDSKAYIGGYVGEIAGVDKVYVLKDFDDGEEEIITNLVLNQNIQSEIKNMYSGLLFGKAAGTNFNFFAPAQSKGYKIVGGIYQTLDTEGSVKNAYIGGLIGDVNAQTSANGISVNFNLGRKSNLEDKLISTAIDTRKTELASNETSYSGSTSIAYSIAGGSAQSAIGAYFGKTAGTVSLTAGSATIEGLIDILSSNSSGDNIGAIIGQVDGNFNTSNASITNSLDIAYQNNESNGTAYIGGIVGQLTRQIDTNVEIAYKTSMSGDPFIHYVGNVVSNVNKLNFGGGFGYIQRQAYGSSDAAIQISNVAFGGALKVWGQISGATVNAGGIVGAFDLGPSTATAPYNGSCYTISNNYSYGDVFVNYSSEDQKLSTYNFGGIVGVANCINIESNYSLTTSFNNRLSGTNKDSGENWTVGTYNVGAIVGENSEIVNYSDTVDKNNYYNSGVCMTYQTEAGNVDAVYDDIYSDTDAYAGGYYLGYSSALENDASIIGQISSDSSIGLLDADFFGRFVSGAAEGTKLNPFRLNGKDYTTFDNLTLSDEGKTHNISWVAVVNDYTLEDTNLKDELNNVAIVGNGHTITRTLGSNNGVENAVVTEAYSGGLVDVLGDSGANFSMISGLVVNLEINADVTTSNASGSATSNNVFGGVVGKTAGQAFIYGVSVKGELSVGSSGDLHLGGIVGQMYGGFVNECAVDADIIYRGNNSTGSTLSAVADCVGGKTTIKATYSSGTLKTYVSNIPIYALGYGSTAAGTHDFVNCYSISNIERLDVEGTNYNDGTNYLVNVGIENQTSELFYLAGMGITSDSYGTEKYVSNMAVGYSGSESDLIKKYSSLMAVLETENDESGNPVINYESLTQWYFNPFVNYGFASHGFGYMKNVTAYERTRGTKNYIEAGKSEVTTSASMQIENAETGEIKSYDEKFNIVETAVVKSYKYSPVGYYDLVTSGENDDANTYQNTWYLGVLNSGKFAQMVATASTEGTKNYKFVLSEDIKVLNDGNVTGETFGQDVGSKGFVLDGNGHTIDFASDYYINEENEEDTITYMSSGIFGTVIGDIINLKISNIKIDNSEKSTQSIGSLAASLTGNLNNITVDGTLINKSSIFIGGVIGELEGNATAVDSLVNIENYVGMDVTDAAKINTNTSTYGSIVGGIVGYLINGGTISHSANSGIINSLAASTVSTNNNYSKLSLSATVTEIEFNSQQSTTISYFSSISGGIAGYTNGGNVKYSYNTNAVMSGYTGTDYGNFIAGGVVGYANATTLVNNNNTGLVGAGNYENIYKNGEDVVDNYHAIAGGIFGYGTGGTTISNCTNEGAVEALGPEDGDYDFAFRRYDGGEYTQDLTSAPSYLKLEVTLTYNPGDTRQVFAYGLGILGVGSSSGSFGKGNYTSTDNIKNDGNIGQVSVTNYIYFDREGMLNNGNGNFEATFALGGYDSSGKQETISAKAEDSSSDTNAASKYIYTNGVDSYGFPIRIYMKDIMTRRYVGDSTGDYVNQIEAEAFKLKPSGGPASWNQWNQPVAEWVFTSNGSTNNLKVDNTSYDGDQLLYNIDYAYNEFSDDDYTMPSTTEYYASTFFPKYDDLLSPSYYNSSGKWVYKYYKVQTYSMESSKFNGTNVNAEINFCLTGEKYNGSNTSPTHASTISKSAIDANIAKIDELKDSNESMIVTTVGGKSTAVVSTGGQISSVYNPYSVSVEVDLSNLYGTSSGDALNTDSIDKNSFKVECFDTNGNDVTEKITYYVATEGADHKWTVKAYFGSNVGVEKMNVSVEYQKTGSVTLGNNNITVSESNVTITLEDENSSETSTSNLKDLIPEFLISDADKKTSNSGKYLNSIEITSGDQRASIDYDNDCDGTTESTLALNNDGSIPTITFNTSELRSTNLNVTNLNGAVLKFKYTEYSWVTSYSDPVEISNPAEESHVSFTLPTSASIEFSNQETVESDGVNYTYDNITNQLTNLSTEDGSQIIVGSDTSGYTGKYYNGSLSWTDINGDTISPSGEIAKGTSITYTTKSYQADFNDAVINMNGVENIEVVKGKITYYGPDSRISIYTTEECNGADEITPTQDANTMMLDSITNNGIYYLKIVNAGVKIYNSDSGYSYTMTVTDSSTNVVDIKHLTAGSLEYQLSVGDTVTVNKYSKVSLGADSSFDGRLIKVKKKSGDDYSELASYNVSSETLDECSYCNGSGCTVVTTSFSESFSEDNINYSYSIYSCGAIEVSKIVSTTSTDGSISYDTEKSYKIVLKDKVFTKYQLTGYVEGTEESEGGFIWGDGQKVDHNDFKTLQNEFEYIVSGIENYSKTLYFAKTAVLENGQALMAECTTKSWGASRDGTRYSNSINLYYYANIKDSYDLKITQIKDPDKLDESSVVYRVDGVTSSISKVDGEYIITNSNYGQKKYNYYYRITRTYNYPSAGDITSHNSTGAAGDSITFVNVILASDVSMGNNPIATNSKNLYGDGYVVKISGTQLINKNESDKKLQELKIVQSLAVIGLKENDSKEDKAITITTITTNVGYIKNVSYFGSIRVGEVKDSSEEEKSKEVNHSVTLFSGISDNTTGLNSNLAVTTVGNVNLVDSITDTGRNVNNNILITADGEMGTVSDTSTTAGGDGVTAGTIESTSKNYTRAGYDGLGGYGGNGTTTFMKLDGTKNTDNGGASAGNNGGSTLRNSTQYNGNIGNCMPGTAVTSTKEGIGSTGFINDNEYFGGGINEIIFGEANKEIHDWAGDGTPTNLLNLFKLGFKVYSPDEGWPNYRYGLGTSSRETIVGNGNEYIKKDVIQFKLNKISTVYVRVQIQLDARYEGVDDGYYPWHYRVIVWTSGEIVNSGTYGTAMTGLTGNSCAK